MIENLIQKKRLDEVALEIKASDFNEKGISKVGFDNILEFFQHEFEFWQNMPGNNLRNHVYNGFKSIVEELTLFKKNQIGYNDIQFEKEWKALSGRIQSNSNEIILYSFLPIVQLLVNKSNHFVQGVENYIKILKGGNLRNQNQNDEFYGFVLAHDHARINSKCYTEQMENIEKQSISAVISYVQKQFDKKKTEFDQIVSDISNVHQKSDESLKQIEAKISETSSKVNELFTGIIEKRSELEKNYGELLRLKKPLEYWQARADALDKTKTKWFLVLTICTSIMMTILLLLLYAPPKIFNLDLFKGDPIAVKGIILFIAFLSFGAYIVKISSKILISAIHLREDANERRDLTHVYLALNAESNEIPPGVSQIVYQSLFGRADTGLLKGDGGPVLPGEIVKKIQV